MKKVYEDKEEGIQVFESTNGRFYPKFKKKNVKFLKILNSWTTVYMGRFDNNIVSANSKEEAVELIKFLRDNPQAQKLGMELNINILDRIAQMRVNGLTVEIDEKTKTIKNTI